MTDVRNKRWSRYAALLLVPAVSVVLWYLFASGGPGGGGPAKQGARGRKLATIPGEYQKGPFEIVFSQDGTQVAYAAGKDGKYFVVVGNKKGRAYDRVRDIALSPDGSSVAYSAGIGKEEFPLVNGREGPPYQSVCDPVFSPDSSMVAWEIQKGRRWYIMACDVRSVRMKESEGADMHSMRPVWTPDSRWLTYIEHHREKKKHVRVVSNADMTEFKKGEAEAFVNVTYSRDGWQAAYAALQGGKYVVIESDLRSGVETAGPEYDKIWAASFSPDARHVAYAAEKKGKRFLVVDGRETTAEGIFSPPVFSPDSAMVAYAAAKEGKQFIVVDDEQGPGYDRVSLPVFNHDGSVVAYAAQRGAEWFLVVDGREGTAYDMVVSPLFSPDGSRIVYRARKEGERFVVIADDEGMTLAEHPAYEMVWQPVFTPDGTSIAYGVKTGRELWWKVEPVE